ncbi:hypothetical protein [Psychrobacter sp. UBA3068]|jgi:hypothetical protein|uniref:hypothetical protein n=1 Tax=Psychrobacter sp. UBA3068 TaxID=1947349 RepID=UPI00258083F2|nr:hypothetical protein [Psychrobacter sp. UBA3068]
MDASVWTQIIMAFCAFIGISYKIITDRISEKKGDLEKTKSVLDRQECIKNSKKYLQDLEINNITYLKGFTWEQVEVLLRKDLRLITISELRFLNKDKLVVIRNDEIIIPTKMYILKKKCLSIRACMIVGNFIFSVIAVGWAIFNYSLFSIVSASFYIYMLFAEVIAIHHFESLTSFDLIKKSGDMARNTIVVSTDFDREV